MYRLWLRLTLGLGVSDAQCGFKAVSPRVVGDIVPTLVETGWLFDTELLAHAQARGWRTVGVPVDWIEQSDLRRRSALRLWTDGWGLLVGAWRIRRNLSTPVR